MASSLLIVVAVSVFFDGIQVYLQGPIRAIGLQSKVSFLTLVSFYGIGLPLACLLSLYFSYGVIGL